MVCNFACRLKIHFGFDDTLDAFGIHGTFTLAHSRSRWSIGWSNDWHIFSGMGRKS
jgi:hypothetical protein